jgi:hypothetical protein
MDQVLDFVKRVLRIRLKWDFSVTSWGRTSKRNTFIHGVPGSLHMVWGAVDVVLDDQQKNVEFEKDCSAVGLQAIYEQDHYHLQPSG